jgi:hypothetical protein
MAITGGIKFFERSSALFSDGATATASSNSAAANNILTNRQLVYWESIGSSDTVTETITVTYSQSVTIDRIILNRHNFKEFTVKYDVMGTPTDFTSVVGLDGALAGGISETAFADETAYYEVASISTTVIYITATKTRTADQEKQIYNLFTTEEIGTMVGFPEISPINITRNQRSSTVLSGRTNTQKAFKTKSFSLTLATHGEQSDHNLVSTLQDEANSFLVWLCGGRRGTTYFTYEIDGFKLRDVFNMQSIGSITPSYTSNSYLTAPNNSISFVESI